MWIKITQIDNEDRRKIKIEREINRQIMKDRDRQIMKYRLVDNGRQIMKYRLTDNKRYEQAQLGRQRMKIDRK